ncbi:hypothetical protein [Halorubrum distributum]|uniref:hypothetical protein n=1 Tax=Halorubrum distributum TaxID=29283 RepID=UPI0012673536|nr:hypothetical protein [Halorubrum distributum]
MNIGSIPVWSILGVVVPLIALYYRYGYGAKSHVSLSRLVLNDDSDWRDGRSNDQEICSKRIFIVASNSGWREGIVSGVELVEAVVWDEEGNKRVVLGPQDSILKIELEHFEPDGRSTRLDLEKETDFSGQIIPGRDDERFAVLPFILKDSELWEAMKNGERGRFVFKMTIEDNKRLYPTSVDVSTSLTYSTRDEISEGQ